MYQVKVSNTAASTLRKASREDRELIKEIFNQIARDPFDRDHVRKLKGDWEGCYRARRGHWRVIFLPPEKGVINVVYIRKRAESTYRK